MTQKFAGTLFATTLGVAAVSSTVFPSMAVQVVAAVAVVASLMNVLWMDNRHKQS